MKKIFINSLIISLLFFITFVNIDCKKQNKLVINAAYVPAGYYLPFLVAEHEKLFEKRGYSINLQSFQDNAHMISLFLNGHLDVTAQSAFTMFPIEEDYPNHFKYIYGQYANSYFFMVSITSEIKTLKNLKNYTIGTWKSPTAVNFIKIILKGAGLNEADYKIQRFGALDWAPALENQVVPAVFGFDIPLGKLYSSGKFRYIGVDSLHQLIPDNYIFNGGAFISSKVIDKDPQKATAIRDGLLEAISLINNDPERVAQIAAKALNSEVDIVRVAKFDIFVAPDDKLIASAEATLQLLKEHNIVHKDISIKSMFWPKNQ